MTGTEQLDQYRLTKEVIEQVQASCGKLPRYTIATQINQEIVLAFNSGQINSDNYKSYIEQLIQNFLTPGVTNSHSSSALPKLRLFIPSSQNHVTGKDINTKDVNITVNNTVIVISSSQPPLTPQNPEGLTEDKFKNHRLILFIWGLIFGSALFWGGDYVLNNYGQEPTIKPVRDDVRHFNNSPREVSDNYYNTVDELEQDIDGTTFHASIGRRLRPTPSLGEEFGIDQLKRLKEQGVTTIYLWYEPRGDEERGIDNEPYEMFKDFKIVFNTPYFKNVKFISEWTQPSYKQTSPSYGRIPDPEYLKALFNNKYIKTIDVSIKGEEQFNKLLPYLRKTPKQVCVRTYGMKSGFRPPRTLGSNIRIH